MRRIAHASFVLDALEQALLLHDWMQEANAVCQKLVRTLVLYRSPRHTDTKPELLEYRETPQDGETVLAGPRGLLSFAMYCRDGSITGPAKYGDRYPIRQVD